jgi:hypothetical protein
VGASGVVVDILDHIVPMSLGENTPEVSSIEDEHEIQALLPGRKVQQSDITGKWSERNLSSQQGKRRKRCPESRNPHVNMRNPEPQGNFLKCEPPSSKLNTLVDQTKVFLFVTKERVSKAA